MDQMYQLRKYAVSSYLGRKLSSMLSLLLHTLNYEIIFFVPDRLKESKRSDIMIMLLDRKSQSKKISSFLLIP